MFQLYQKYAKSVFRYSIPYSYLIFFCVTAGILFHLTLDISNILPQNILWLLQGGDWSQHFLGWHFYRNTPWEFPLGNFTGLHYPSPTNIGYTDSIPLFAIPAKSISSFIDVPFQFIGIWIYLNFALQGILGYRILKGQTTSLSFALLGGVLLQTSSVLLHRLGHPALTAHWIILWAILIYLSKNYTKTTLWSSLLLLSIAAWIHPYIAVMGLTILIAYYLRAKKLSHKILYSGLAFITILIHWYSIGYLTSYATTQIFGLGHYSSSWTTFVQSPYSKSLSQIPFNSLQSEGAAFLGLGTLIGICSLLLTTKRSQMHHFFTKTIPTHWPLILFISMMSLYAFTHYTIFDRLAEQGIPGYSYLSSVFITFRANGRFIWPGYYLIIIVFLINLKKRFKAPQATILLLILLAINIYDAPNTLLNRRTSHSPQPLKIEAELQDIIQDNNYTHIMFYPTAPNMTTYFNQDDYIPFAFTAANNNLSINIGYLARGDDELFHIFNQAFTQDLYQGILQPEYLYIIPRTHRDQVETYLENTETTRQLRQLTPDFWYIP